MKKLFIIPLFLLSSVAFAQFNTTAIVTQKRNMWKDIGEKFSVAYFTDYSGPTLANNNNGTKTWNRYYSGKDDYGFRKDASANTQLFHAFSVSYKALNNLNIGLSYSYSNTLQSGTQYKWKSKRTKDYYEDPNDLTKITKSVDSYETYSSDTPNGRYDYDPRLNFFIPTVYENSYIGISTGLSYEFSYQENSKESGKQYGLILAPSLRIKSNNPKLSYGINATIQRDFYNEDYIEDRSACTPGFKCTPYITENRTLKANTGHYLNYSLNDTFTVQTSTNFDWDQVGKQTGTNDFGNNLDDVAKLGLGIRLSDSMNTSTYLMSPLEDAATDKTVLGLTFGMSI